MATKTSFWTSPPGWAALGLIGAASYFLLLEHRAHLFAAWQESDDFYRDYRRRTPAWLPRFGATDSAGEQT